MVSYVNVFQHSSMKTNLLIMSTSYVAFHCIGKKKAFFTVEHKYDI